MRRSNKLGGRGRKAADPKKHNLQEMVHLWIVFCRSVIEQSCVVWHGSLTQENIDNLECTQKRFAKLVMKEKYQNYVDALLLLNLDSLETRRNDISLKIAQAGIKNNKRIMICCLL